MTTPVAAPRPQSLGALAPFALPLACLAWAFWTTLVELAQTWNSNPQYSHGFLVPAFAAFLLYLRRDQIDPEGMRRGAWFRLLGAGLLLLGVAVRLAGTWWFYVSADPISLLPCLAGVVLLVGGRAAWRWAWPAVLFLAFMIPLPFRVASALSGPLQRLATVTSTYVMQTLGLPALAEGNVILLNEHQIGIVEACSGLRMLVVFFALSTAMVLVVRRHWLDRVLILASAVPIALVSNIGRVTGTGVMYEMGYSEMANHFFHDAAGWLMMPMALGMLWAELWLLSHLFLDAPATRVPSNPARRAAAAGVPKGVPHRTRRQPQSRPAAPRPAAPARVPAQRTASEKR
jgi:exosortase